MLAAWNVVPSQTAKEPRGRFYDGISIRSDDVRESGGHAFDPLGLCPSHNDRHSQRRSFLLDATTVSDDHAGTGEQSDEVAVVDRIHNERTTMIGELRLDVGANRRVRVRSMDHAKIGERVQQRPRCCGHVADARAPILATV